MHKILEQLTWVFGRGKDLWEEPEETKKVRTSFLISQFQMSLTG